MHYTLHACYLFTKYKISDNFLPNVVCYQHGWLGLSGSPAANIVLIWRKLILLTDISVVSIGALRKYGVMVYTHCLTLPLSRETVAIALTTAIRERFAGLFIVIGVMIPLVKLFSTRTRGQLQLAHIWRQSVIDVYFLTVRLQFHDKKSRENY